MSATEHNTASIHKIAIVVKFMPASNVHSSRISLSLPRFDGKRKVIDFDHSFNNTFDIAAHWLASKGVAVECHMETKDSYTLACDWSQREAIFAAFGINR